MTEIGVMTQRAAVLRVAVAQPALDRLSLRGSAREHAELIHRAGADLIVFPELSLTGYRLDAVPVSPDDPSIATIAEACAAARCTALVGAPVCESGRRHIAILRIEASSAAVAYRKCHLGGDEIGRYARGPGPCAIEIQGWSVGLGICRDTGVRSHIIDTAALGIDLYACGVVHHRWETGEQRRRARMIAQECRAPVAMASFAGPTGGGYHDTAAHSTISTDAGVVVADAGPEPGSVAVFDLDRDARRRRR